MYICTCTLCIVHVTTWETANVGTRFGTMHIIMGCLNPLGSANDAKLHLNVRACNRAVELASHKIKLWGTVTNPIVTRL